MKNIFLSLLLLSVAGILVFSCKKNTLSVAPFDVVDGQALFKLNYASPYSKNPAVQIKIDTMRVSSNITYNTPFPGGGLNTGGSSNADYLFLSPGEHTVSLSIPKVGTGDDSVQLYSTKIEVKGNVYQTLHVTDTGAATQSVLTTDLGALPDSGLSKFVFVNLVPGSSMDLYFGSRKLASKLAYKAISDTFSIPSASVAIFAIRRSDSSATSVPLATYPINGTSNYTIPNQRAFTAYARGYLGVTDAVRKPQLSLLFNK